ncbi:hypothetical protein AZG88_43260 [Rhodococcus sp. LB1]|nr:hypothetical protein AZG88_43260 [Rhodococcus sp. LB1]
MLIAAVAWWASAVSVVIVRALLIRRRPARTLQGGPEWWDLDQAYPTEDGASWQARARCFRSCAVKARTIGSAALHIPAVNPTFSTVPHSSTVGV